MPDNTLSFETRVDLSGLNAGVNQAKSVVGQFGTAAKEAMERARDATERLAQAQAMLGASAEQGSARAKEIIAEYTEEAQKATSAASQYAQAARGATTSVQELAAAESQETTVLRSSISARMAGSAELRVLSGNIQGSNRAAAAFLATLPGIGAAMQMAFPIFGAVALLEVLGQAVTGVEHLIKAFHDLSGAEVDAAIQAQNAGEKIIAIKASHKVDTETIARMVEGAPFVDIQVKNAATALKQIEYQRQLADIAAQNAEAGLKGSALQAQRVKDLEAEAGFARQAAAETQKMADVYQIVLQAKAKSTQVGAPFNPKVLTDEQDKIVLEQRARVLAAKEQFEQDARVAEAKIPGVNKKEAAAGETEAEKAARKAAEEERKAREELYRSMEEDLNKEKVLHNVSVKEEFDYWTAKLAAFDDGTEQYAAIMQKLGSLASSGSSKAHEEIQKLIEKAKRDAEEDEKGFEEAAKGMIAAQNMVRDATEAAAESRHEANAGRIETAQASSANANATSLVPDPQEQLNALRSFHQQAIEEDERFIQEEIRIYANEPKKVEELTKQLEQIRRKGNLEWLTDTKNIALQVAQAEQTAIKSMENDIANMFEKAISRQETWAQASVKLYQQVADQFILNLVKMGEQELLALALHKGVMSSKILADAKGAAADSYQWASTWGGPIAGAIAAAAAFAGVLAFDSFEQGGIVNGSHGMPVPIMAHAGERVLSAPQTQNFERMVNGGGGSSSSSNHLTYAPQINAYDRSGMKSILQSHKDDIMNIVRSGYNAGSLNR